MSPIKHSISINCLSYTRDIQTNKLYRCVNLSIEQSKIQNHNISMHRRPPQYLHASTITYIMQHISIYILQTIECNVRHTQIQTYTDTKTYRYVYTHRKTCIHRVHVHTYTSIDADHTQYILSINIYIYTLLSG